jgi:membrane associated rhomboid family serine protease
MFPLKDHNPTRTRPYVTMLFVAINVVVFAYELMLGDRLETFVAAWGAVPYELTRFEDLVGPVGGGFEHAPGPSFLPLTLISSMFMHGSVMHIFGNMLYLWIFGNNVEDVLGHAKYVVFYLLCGIVAGLAHVMFNPNSTIPTVGASGAVAGVLGAYLVMYPRARVLSLVFLGIFIRLMEIPASVLLVLWFVMQSLQGFLSLGVSEMSGGVAWFAHIGGFVAGAALAFLFAGSAIRQLRAASRYERP